MEGEQTSQHALLHKSKKNSPKTWCLSLKHFNLSHVFFFLFNNKDVTNHDKGFYWIQLWPHLLINCLEIGKKDFIYDHISAQNDHQKVEWLYWHFKRPFYELDW